MKKWQDIVKESSLSRIQDKMSKHSAGAITAFRGDLTRKENKERNKELLSALKTKGYSVTKVKGSYIEQFGTKDAKEVGEESWFVVDDKIDGDDNGKLEKDLIALGKKYDQDSILTIRDGKGFLIGTSKRDNAFPSFGKKEPVGKGKFGKVSGEFFSRIRGRQFAFESTDPLTINGKWALKKMGERVWSEIVNESEAELNETDIKVAFNMIKRISKHYMSPENKDRYHTGGKYDGEASTKEFESIIKQVKDNRRVNGIVEKLLSLYKKRFKQTYFRTVVSGMMVSKSLEAFMKQLKDLKVFG